MASREYVCVCAYTGVHSRTFERNRCIILTRLVNGTSAEMKTASHVDCRDTREKRSVKIIKSACHTLCSRETQRGALSIIDADGRGVNAF